jgi:hypothetical protein
MFTIIKSHENHYAIIDERSVTLGYRYCIKPELLKIFKETIVDLSDMGVITSKRGNYPMYHYTVRCNYSKDLYESTNY